MLVLESEYERSLFGTHHNQGYLRYTKSQKQEVVARSNASETCPLLKMTGAACKFKYESNKKLDHYKYHILDKKKTTK